MDSDFISTSSAENENKGFMALMNNKKLWVNIAIASTVILVIYLFMTRLVLSSSVRLGSSGITTTKNYVPKNTPGTIYTSQGALLGAVTPAVSRFNIPEINYIAVQQIKSSDRLELKTALNITVADIQDFATLCLFSPTTELYPYMYQSDMSGVYVAVNTFSNSVIITNSFSEINKRKDYQYVYLPSEKVYTINVSYSAPNIKIVVAIDGLKVVEYAEVVSQIPPDNQYFSIVSQRVLSSSHFLLTNFSID